MNWRLFGLGFVCFTLAFGIATGIASDASKDQSNRDQSPLNDPNDRTIVSSIDRMKHRLSEGQITDRVLVNIRVFEFEPEQLIQFVTRTSRWERYRFAAWFDLESPQLVDRLTWYGLWDADELQQLTTHPETPSWSSPPISLVSGREARYKLGGHVPALRRADDGWPALPDETYGRTIVTTATISNLNRIHLVVASEVSDQTTSNGMASVGNKRRLDATFEMNHGETRAMGRKVVSTSGRETYQLMQATAWLQPFEVPLDPETIAVSAAEELSTPEKDVAEFNATRTTQSDIPTRIDMTSVSGASIQPVNQVADDSVFARQMRRIDRNNVADEVRLSVVVTEVTRFVFDLESRPFRGYGAFYTWEPNFYASFAHDVVGVETIDEPFASRARSTEIDCSDWSGRICRPYRWEKNSIGTKWRLPTTLVESGSKVLWRSGGEVPVVTLDQYRRESIANEKFGLTVTATPTITDLDEIQVHLDIALKDFVQSAKSLRVESARRMRTTARVRNGEIVSFGQPAVSDTGQESFVTVSVTASTMPPIHEPTEKDLEITSALFPENSDAIRKITPVNATFATLFGAGGHQGCWADSTLPNLQKINNNLDALERHRILQPDAEVTQLSYRLSHPFDESSQLFADP